LEELAGRFHQKHEQTYGHANPSEAVYLVNLRVTALGRLPRLTISAPFEHATKPSRRREVWFSGQFLACDVHWRQALAPGATIIGPAIVDSLDSTIVVPPRWTASIDHQGFMRIRRS
jgi:N-methylhydantoinase A